MKKTYEKPQIMFEDFTLSTNIAAGCEVKTDTQANGTCAYTTVDEFLGAVNIFLEGISACTTKAAGGEYNGFCYHNPYDSNNLFNS